VPARFPSCGPANIYYAVGGITGLWTFLGTCESAPFIRPVPEYVPAMADVGGPVKPTDWVYAGEDGLVVARLNRWDDLGAYDTLRNRPRHAGTGLGGQNIAGDIGSLMMRDGLGLGLVIQFPNFLAPQNVAQGMPPGYRFFNVESFGPDEIKPGTDTETLDLVFRCMRVYQPVGGGTTVMPLPGAVLASIGLGGWAYYDNAIPALPVPS
jgi:hypothetical protein